ncbi:MAG: response regulator transcription factor [Chitinophagaceae bacterium]
MKSVQLPIRILLFDDNNMLRISLEELLNDSEEVRLIAHYDSCKNLLQEIEIHQPDVILMDIEMPEINGIMAVKMIRAKGIDIPILMQTVFDDDNHVFNAIAAGAGGYILKNCTIDKLIIAIKEVHEGGAPMSPPIAKKVLSHLQQTSHGNNDYKLTQKEKEVLNYLVQGLPYKQIASKMNITYDTVRAHMKKIYEKLHVSSMTEAVVMALKHKLL